jgi:nucleotide-binding universal stress UspA family protein
MAKRSTAATQVVDEAWAAWVAAVVKPSAAPYLGGGLRPATKRLISPYRNPLAGQLANLADLAERDLDRAVIAICRIADSLRGGGPVPGRPQPPSSGAVALAEAQAEAIGAALEAAFADLGLDPERVAETRARISLRFAQVRDGETYEPWFPG